MSDTPWMDPDEVAAYLGVSKQTIGRYRREHGLPVHRINHNEARYHRDEVDAWVREESDRYGVMQRGDDGE